MDVRDKAKRFHELHAAGTFVMPNAWSPGSAAILEGAGFTAIGTTSGGVAFEDALPDGIPDTTSVLGRDAAVASAGRIAAAVDVPVSIDSENAYGDAPEDVAETIRQVAAAGVVGASIEDFTKRSSPLFYDRTLAVERVRAAREAADATGMPFTITARADHFLYRQPDALAETIARANLFREAGADCLYVPGPSDVETIGTLVREIAGPLNVVMGFSGGLLTVDRLAELGVRRISIGASLARAVFRLIRDAAEEIRDHGTFSFAERQIPHFELARFFAERRSKPSS